MIQAFRICQRQFAKRAFSGEGARLYGGRWNNPGTPLVYLAGSVSLAQLEMLVHLESDEVLNSKYVIIPVWIPSHLIKTLDVKALPRNWRSAAAPSSTRKLGDRWVQSCESPVLRVPSVIVPQESNYLLNPAHSSFDKLSFGKPDKLIFDSRLA